MNANQQESAMADGTVIYTVSSNDAKEHSVAFATLEEAKKYRAGLRYPDGAITKVTVAKMPIRKMLAAVYNRDGFAAESKEVVSAHRQLQPAME
jgi:hypothetical protein